jgi:hypothetical protein
MQNSLHHNFIDNPIMRHEALTLNRQRGKWFWRIMFALTTLLILSPVFLGFSRYFYDSVGVAATFLVIANVFIYPMVVIRAITTSTSLEHGGKTWDLLILTGVSNWRLVLGKWLGVMRFIKRDFIWLYVVRIATLLWLNISINLNQDYNGSRLLTEGNNLVNLFNIRIRSDTLLLFLGMVLVFTVSELMMSSAIGLAFSFFKWKARTRNNAAVGVRIALAVAIPMLYVGLFYAYGNSFYEYGTFGYFEFFNLRSSTMLIDNGMGSIGFLLGGESNNETIETIVSFVAFHMGGLVIYAIFTLLALQLAVNRASARGANVAEANPMKMKPKRKAKIQPKLASSATHSEAQSMSITQDTVNIFNLSDAENRTVEVYHYQRHLGRMYLRIAGENETIYILLSNVAYIEAPSFWKGANFHTASQSEYESFVQQKQIRVNGLATDAMRLYQSNGVRIIAGNAQILDELPMNI